MDVKTMGLFFALTIITLWLAHLTYLLTGEPFSPGNPLAYLHILLQAYLYTGLFITGHDAMHGTVTKNRILNKAFGWASSLLYAGMFYSRLLKNHKLHHKYPGTDQDPDYNAKTGNFFLWWFTFMIRYATVGQIIIMAGLYNILKYLGVPEISLILYWVVPALLSSLQLFFFGTYLPHRQPHDDTMKPHNARTLKRNHLWAMISCYFFGYHREHHEAPYIPWWKLYSTK